MPIRAGAVGPRAPVQRLLWSNFVMTLLLSYPFFSTGRRRSRGAGGWRTAPVVAGVLLITPAAWAQDGGPAVGEAVAPAVAAQSLRLDRLLGDLTAARPATLDDAVWTFAPAPGRELVVLPVAIDAGVSGVALDDPAFSVQAARFLAWVLPDESPDAGRAGGRSGDTGPTEEELLDLGRLLADPDGEAAAALSAAEPGALSDPSDGLPEGVPRATRSLELLPGGRVAWVADRSLPGTVRAAANPPTEADVYRLKLDPEQVRAMKPERPERLARTAGEDRRVYDLRVREANEAYRSQSEAFRTLTDAVRSLPERFEAPRPAVVFAVFEANASGDLILRGHPAGRWAVSRDDLETLGRLATGGGGGGGSRGGGLAVGLTTEQASDMATLARLAADGHPWAQRAAALGLAGSGYLAEAGPDANDVVGGVARRLLASEDAIARNRTVFALAQLESATPAVASLLASASMGAGDPAVDAAAVRARLAVEVAGPAGADPRGGRGGGGPVDMPAVGRVVNAANQMLQAADGPDAGAVVRELLAATGDASSGGRGGGGAGDVEAALIGGLSFDGLPPERFDAAAQAVMESADLYPAVAGGWLNRQLLGSADRGQVEQTLDLLNAVSEPAPVVGAVATRLRRLVLGGGDGAAAGRKPRLNGGLPLDSANHALFRVLSSGDPGLRQKGWRALRWFALPGDGPGSGGGRAAATDDNPDVLLEAVLSAALSRAATPESLVPFLTRQPGAEPVGSAVTRALLRVTAQGDTRSARRAARALLGAERSVAEALDALDADGRARFAARLYDRLAGSLSPVTGLIRAEGSTLTRFLGEALAAGRLPDAAEWADAAGREETLYGHATGPDDALARAAIAALAALAGADTPGQLAAAGAFEDRRRGMRPEAFGEAWAGVRQVIFTARLAEAAGDYRLVVTLRGRVPAVADGGGLASDPVLGTDPAAYGGDGAGGPYGADPAAAGGVTPEAAEHEQRFVLGVVELIADGGTVRLGAGTPEITVPDDQLAIRLPSPGDLKNLEVEELQDLPLERIDGPLDLLPDGHGGWSGAADLADGRRFELRLEPHGR